MDEKVMVSLNKLNEAYRKQLNKRIEAGTPGAERAATYMTTLLTTSDDGYGTDDFAADWRKYYPKLVQILGWADFIIPDKFGIAVKALKALLAVVDAQIIPDLEEKKPA